jgi:O-antigen ligase
MNSFDILVSLKRIQQYFYCVVTFFLIYFTVKTKKQLEIIMLLMVIVGTIAACVGIFELLSNKEIFKYFGNHSIFGGQISERTLVQLIADRIDGIQGDADYHAIIMVQTIIFCFFLFNIVRSGFLRIVIGVVIILCVVNLAGTGSRGGLIACFISGFVYFTFAKMANKVMWSAALLMILTASVLALYFFSDITSVERYFSKDKRSVTSINLRIQQLRIGMHMVKDHPLIGIGPDGYELQYHRYAPHISPEARKTRKGRLLNTYQQVLVEYGILGLAQFLVLIFVPLRNLYLQMKTSVGKYRYMVLAILAATLGHSFFLLATQELMDLHFWKLIAFSASIKEFSKLPVSDAEMT